MNEAVSACGNNGDPSGTAACAGAGSSFLTLRRASVLAASVLASCCTGGFGFVGFFLAFPKVAQSPMVQHKSASASNHCQSSKKDPKDPDAFEPEDALLKESLPEPAGLCRDSEFRESNEFEEDPEEESNGVTTVVFVVAVASVHAVEQEAKSASVGAAAKVSAHWII